MAANRLLHGAIGNALKPAGFKNKSDNWFRATDDTVCVVNLQKSSYGPQYYINLGIWLNAAGTIDNPKDYKCHIRMRWGHLIPVDRKVMERILDLQNDCLSDAARATEITEYLRTYIVPFLVSAGSLAHLRTIYGSERLPSHFVNAVGREILAA